MQMIFKTSRIALSRACFFLFSELPAQYEKKKRSYNSFRKSTIHLCIELPSSQWPFSTLSQPNYSTERPSKHFLPLCNSILRASLEKGSFDKAIMDHRAMLLFIDFKPDHRTHNLLLKACNKSSNLEAAMEIHVRITKTGFLSHGSVVTPLFRFYIDHNHIMEAQMLFDDVLNLKWDINPFYGNLMIMELFKRGEVDKANCVFKRMPCRDLVSWNSMIAGLVKNLRPKEAMSIFGRMIGLSFKPDGFSFSAVLSACARLGARGYGEWVHSLMVENGVEFNHILNSAIIDMYAKCGGIEVAREIFNSIKRNHVSIWNSMINGLAIHGLGLDASEVFSKMEREGLTPDGVTFVAVLTACSHCGLVEKARSYFDMMKVKYSIDPKIEHFGAMVDALARASLLEEAYDMIRSMTMEPDVAIWRALLSGCRGDKHAELGEVAIGQMAYCGSGDYVILSSIYSSAKRWDHAEKVWEVMKEKKIRKNRGLSWVEFGQNIHQFKAGDRSHPETDGIYRILNSLAKRVKAEGFAPMIELVTMDILEEEREENLSCHSEKLAVAYCVLKTAPGTEILVAKNLRTCNDCHEWMKMISKVLCRVIVVRDRIRFHRFEKGSCSCKDYW
ncbi:pentatricopeptide repeat-containing protein At5g50990 [Typha angustifolia]|uniref:pentatricopeptide repeat-containing protein At5g50990 n=1 Tax=Typha angustifolia TaxID=59011 RepID=UPI003C30D09C